MRTNNSTQPFSGQGNVLGAGKTDRPGAGGGGGRMDEGYGTTERNAQTESQRSAQLAAAEARMKNQQDKKGKKKTSSQKGGEFRNPNLDSNLMRWS